MNRFAQAAALAFCLGACAPAPPTSGLIVPPDDSVPVPSAPGRECSNAGLHRFTGRVATGEVGAEMLRVSGARIIRWAQPGTMMTMEFSPERLTVHLNAGNVIVRAACG